MSELMNSKEFAKFCGFTYIQLLRLEDRGLIKPSCPFGHKKWLPKDFEEMTKEPMNIYKIDYNKKVKYA